MTYLHAMYMYRLHKEKDIIKLYIMKNNLFITRLIANNEAKHTNVPFLHFFLGP